MQGSKSVRANENSLAQPKHGERCSRVSGLIGKHTYYRKKKLARRNSGSFSHCATAGGSGLQRQSVDKSRKNNIFGDIPESARLENMNVNLKNVEPDICQNAARNAMNLLPGDCVMSTEISSQVVRGISLFHFSSICFGKCWQI